MGSEDYQELIIILIKKINNVGLLKRIYNYINNIYIGRGN